MNVGADDLRLRRAAVLDRRRVRLDAHRPLREHLPAQAGADKYDQLTKHEIPWTDPSVKEALTTMARHGRKQDWLAGGTSGALQTDFPELGDRGVRQTRRRARWSIEGDFVGGDHHRRHEGEGRRPTPSSSRSRPSTGDAAGRAAAATSPSLLKDTPAAEALLSSWRRPRRPRSGPARRLHLAEQERRPARLPRRRSTRRVAEALVDAGDASASTCPTCTRPRSAATDGRASGSSSRTSCEPERCRRAPQQLEAAAKAAYE